MMKLLLISFKFGEYIALTITGGKNHLKNVTVMLI